MVEPMVLNSSWVSPTVVEDCARSSTVLEDRSTAEASCRLMAARLSLSWPDSCTSESRFRFRCLAPPCRWDFVIQHIL